jgi:hypothetical protein
LFEYKHGGLYWKVNRGSAKAGNKAGREKPDGYIQIIIGGVHYYEHRLVFYIHNGRFPKYIDHINGVKSDNRIENLREATPSENQLNRRVMKNNSSGYKGVYRQKGKWCSRITFKKVRYYLGAYDSPLEAYEAYCSFGKNLCEDFFNNGEC